ncbi:NAD(P)-dependent oxidoreductase [Rhizobiaceae bacterium BDR2-2]|uniref:NAD(P)-dependent oxidoreductase n=1 Tax=Ectorhizobium quercum TaxID=2965071 RepID=A0AAE3N0M2_9HYPH|nr:NAD(P)-dependent oxidoreductase [Ectorhizobium quercum]MCX8997125.1 NAD(P)-dependent oxidoreductase [Ectorhizobium quercum]
MNENGNRIGFAGTGKIGLPICLRLRAAGHTVTILPSPRARGVLADELAAAGCAVARTGAALAARTDILITCLPSSAEVETVLTGETGFFSGLSGRQGILHIDHTSGDPDISRRLAGEWRALGGAFVDAAISGTPDLARSGTLKLLCGGTPELLERMQAISKAYASEVIPAGETGSGHMLRLIGGLMGYGMAMLSSEAFLLCAAAGIAPGRLKAMITGTGADSRTFQAMSAAEIEGPNSAARRKLSLATVAKDLDALTAQARQLGCGIPVAETIAGRVAQAAAQGGAEAAISDLTLCLKAIPADAAQE